MDLLLKRAQTLSPGSLFDSLGITALPFLSFRPKFKLWAKIECKPEEQSIISHYKFTDTVLVEGFQEGLFKRSLVVGFWAFLGALILLPAMFGWSMGLFLSLVASAVATYLYYDKHREIVFVRDLLAGRHFMCASVVELARKEAWLETITAFLRQVMESAKHWDGTEVRPIPPLDKDLAKQLIIKGL